jgi:hypothetical protein
LTIIFKTLFYFFEYNKRNMSNTGEFSSCFKLTCTESVSKDLRGEEVVVQANTRASSPADPHFSRLNVNELLLTAVPGDWTVVPGFPGDLKVVVPASGSGSIYCCRTGTGQTTGNDWAQIGVGGGV